MNQYNTCRSSVDEGAFCFHRSTVAQDNTGCANDARNVSTFHNDHRASSTVTRLYYGWIVAVPLDTMSEQSSNVFRYVKEMSRTHVTAFSRIFVISTPSSPRERLFLTHWKTMCSRSPQVLDEYGWSITIASSALVLHCRWTGEERECSDHQWWQSIKTDFSYSIPYRTRSRCVVVLSPTKSRLVWIRWFDIEFLISFPVETDLQTGAKHSVIQSLTEVCS